MKDLYHYCQITKQGHYRALIREKEWQSKERLFVGFIMQIREIHPVMGLRTMYEYYRPEGIGRDAFISIGIYYGFRTKIFRNLTKTTFSSPYSRYKNLLVDKNLNDINQLWTSDLTYFKVGETFYYIVFIMDVYSRMILGYSVADNMRAENNVNALQMAFQYRRCTAFNKQLIHHSDRGGQYISEQYIALLNDAQIQISMCNEVYENAHIERVNGTIKNMYLEHWNITNFEQLQKQLKRAVDTYNNCKPHSAIGGKTPMTFEQYIKELKDENKPNLSIWTCDLSKKQNPNQCIIQF
jgi:transposase InsO family protein